MERDNKKTEYITRKDLESLLGEQTQTILSAFDDRFNKLQTELYAVRTELKTEIREVRIDLKETKGDLRIDINNVQTLIDGYVKSQEDMRQEFEIMKKEHDMMKKIIREKLGLEIKIA